jgi:superfamily I DNA/RNA helicase
LLYFWTKQIGSINKHRDSDKYSLYPKKYRYLFIDEAQDFDNITLKLLFKIAKHINIFYDPSQSIFKNLINKFTKKWSINDLLKDFNKYVLTISYRSNVNIIKLANSLIKNSWISDVILPEKWLFRWEKAKLYFFKPWNKDLFNKLIDEIKNTKEITGIVFETKNEYRSFIKYIWSISPDLLNFISYLEEIDFSKKIFIWTFKAFKWLEFDKFIIVKPSYYFEHNNISLEEKIKTFYVLITRAKKQLYIFENDWRWDEYIKYMDKKYLDIVSFV